MTKSEAGRLGALASAGAQAQQRRVLQATYAESPNKCSYCGGALSYKKREYRFCSTSCSATANNTGRKCPDRTNARKKVLCPCGGTPDKNRVYCLICILLGEALHRATLETAKTEHARRKYLLRTRPHQCQYPDCGITDWLGQPVPLEMDHIDGNSDNNTEENLRLLCPNCHALTPTHKGKNRGHGKRQSRNQRYADGLTY